MQSAPPPHEFPGLSFPVAGELYEYRAGTDTRLTAGWALVCPLRVAASFTGTEARPFLPLLGWTGAHCLPAPEGRDIETLDRGRIADGVLRRLQAPAAPTHALILARGVSEVRCGDGTEIVLDLVQRPSATASVVTHTALISVPPRGAVYLDGLGVCWRPGNLLAYGDHSWTVDALAAPVYRAGTAGPASISDSRPPPLPAGSASAGVSTRDLRRPASA